MSGKIEPGEAAAALFDLGAPPEPAPRLGEAARRTLRQALALERGNHPLALLGSPLRLHPEAPPPGDKKAPGPRCGSCLLALKNEFGYLKCTQGRSGEIFTPSFRGGPYETRGRASDLRYWFPACERWEVRRG
jgi:hypothetical protein